MASIDERVVEMRFNRDDFLKGTEDTLGALERLESSLSGAGGIGAGVDAIGNKMSAFGAIGLGALMKVGGAAVDAGAKIVKNVMDPIFAGGKKRALNLEHANFMLEGILKDGDKVKAVMDDVSFAVDGTAYGLDAAAVAAAQFAASGMVAGDEMKAALRGISGVAAMSGSSYEDVASIFTKVAGQGRLMGDDLNRLASRGINAAATLADSMGVTEEAVRGMVTKGKIDFDTFASAMNDTFGPQAMKANETYAGSLANIKAALARVGAAGYTIEHEKMRRVFNALRPAITAFQKSLTPVWETYERLYAIPMAQKFERWGAALTKIDYGPLMTNLSQLLVIGSTFKDVVASWVKPISDAFNAVFMKAPSSGWMTSIGEFLDGFNRGLGGLKATEGQQAGLQGIFTGLFESVGKVTSFMKSAFTSVAPVFTWFWGVIKTGVGYIVTAFEYLGPIITKAFDSLFGQEGAISSFFEGFRNSVSETGSVFETLGTYLKSFYDSYILPFIESIGRLGDVFKTIKTDGLEGFRAKLKHAFEPMTDVLNDIKKVGRGIGDIFAGVENPFKWISDHFKTFVKATADFVKNIREHLADIPIDFEAVFEALGGALGGAMRAINKLFENVSIQDLVDLAAALSKLYFAMILFRTLKSLKGVFDSISWFFSEGAEAFKRFGQDTASDKLLKVAIAIGILAAALWVLSKVPGADLAKALGTIVLLGLVLVGLSFALDKIDGQGLAMTAFGIGLIVAALFGLTVVMTILGMLPLETIAQGGSAVGMMLIALSAAGVILAQGAEGLEKSAIGILAIAGALTLLIIPIKVLGEMDSEKLHDGMLAVGIALFGLVVAALLLGEASEDVLMGSIALIAMAGALTLMVVPIERLSKLDFNKMMGGIAGLAITLGLLVAAVAVIDGMERGALGVLAISVALLVLAHGIDVVSKLNFEDAALGLLLVAEALAILIAASAAASLVLPGVLALAALVLAFGISAVLAGVGILLMAVAMGVAAANLPAFLEQMVKFVALLPDLLAATPGMVVLGASLLIFGAGATVAGVGAISLGLGLVLMGAGMVMIASVGKRGSDALIAFVDAIMPLIWQTPQIAVIATALTGLGIALGILGGGLGLVAVSVALLGVALVILAIGLALITVVAFAVTPLVDRIVESFGKLGPLAIPLVQFGQAVIVAATGIGIFMVKAQGAADAVERLLALFAVLISIFPAMASTITKAASDMCAAFAMMVACAVVAAGQIGVSTVILSTHFKTMSSSIASSSGPTVSAVVGMMIMTTGALNVGNVQIGTAITAIIKTFTTMATKVMVVRGVIIAAVTVLIQGTVSQLRSGINPISAAIRDIIAAFSKLADGIRNSGSKVPGAVRTIINGVVGALMSGRGAIHSAAFSAGTSVGDGMGAGIRASAGRAASAAAQMGRSAIAAAKSAISAASPSKAFMELGNWSVDGFVLPFQSRVSEVESVSAGMAQSSLDAFNDIVSRLDMDLNGMDEFDFRPTITPVLDLDGVRRQAGGLNGMLSTGFSTDFGMNKATGLAMIEETLRDIAIDKSDKEPSKIEFVQHNTSSKPLDASEIYRQTKNLISQVEQKGL